MLRRIGHLTRARLRMAARSGWPVPALVFLASLASVLALLARDLLPPFPQALLALSLGALLLALPILSDLAAILRYDEAAEWIGTLPARPMELTLARTLHLLALLGALAFAWFVPWGLFAPAETSAGARLLLPLHGLVLVLALATFVVGSQRLLLSRFGAAFVLLETAWMVLAVVALLEILGHLPEIARLGPEDPRLAWFPPAWFARALSAGGLRLALPLFAALPCLGALALVPAETARSPTRRSLLERGLAPLHWLATRFWVRREERGTFELVHAALPREREFVLRTYPMLGIPLAFLWLGASGAGARREDWRSDLLALLLFTAGVSFPLLLTHVPITETPAAAWLQRTAPCSERARREGALKALFVRWIVPLYLALFALGLALGQTDELTRLWCPALALALLLLRFLYPRCVRDLPLSIAPENLRAEVDWAGLVSGIALGLTVLAVVANRALGRPTGLVLALGLVAWEGWLERRGRHPAGSKLGRGVASPSKVD